MATKKAAKSNSDVQRELREKQAAKKERIVKDIKPDGTIVSGTKKETEAHRKKIKTVLRDKTGEAKKSPAPVKPKREQPKKKVAAKKGTSKNRTLVRSNMSDQPEFLTSGDLLKKRERANEVTEQLKSAIVGIATSRAELLKIVRVAQQEESWKWCSFKHPDGTEGPFAGWKQYLLAIAEDLHKSASLVMEASGFVRWLTKYMTDEEMASVPVRKLRPVREAAKKAAEQGKALPPALIEAAKNPQLDEDDIMAEVEKYPDLAPDKPAPADDRQTVIPGWSAPDPLLAKTETNTFPESPRKGGSKVVEGQSGTAQQFSGVVKEAIDAFILISHSPDVPDFDAEEALKGICAQWLNSECIEEPYCDMKNKHAAEEIRKAQKKGKAVSA